MNMLNKFNNPIHNPFPHYWIENFLTPQQYNQIFEYSLKTEYETVGDSCRSSISIGNMDQQFGWLFEANTKQQLVDAFWNSIAYQYPKANKDIVNQQAFVECMIVRDKEGYSMPPHQDGGSMIVGYAQLFLAPVNVSDNYHGIALHQSLQPERRMNMARAVDPNTQGDEYDAFYKDHKTRAVVTYPYKSNCLYAIGCDDTTWHEVKSVKTNFFRYSVIWQLYWNERGKFI